MKKLLAWLAVIGFSLAPISINADPQILTGSVAISATGAQNWISIPAAQTACNFTTSGTFTGLSVTVQISPDNGVTAVTSGYSSAITAVGTVGGNITTAAIPSPTHMRFNVTGLTTGSATIVYGCSSAVGNNTVGSVTQGTSPWVVGQATGTNLHMVCDSGCAAPVATAPPGLLGYAAPNGGATISQDTCRYDTGSITATSGNIYPCYIDSSGNIRVTNTPVGTQTVAGTVTATQSTAANLKAQVSGDTGTIHQTANGVAVDGSGVTQPVSGSVTANAGTGTFNVAGTGTAGAPNAGVVTVQGISSGTNLNINCAAGCSPPYNLTADGQTAVAASALGLVGFNGTTADRLRSTSGALNVTQAAVPSTMYPAVGTAPFTATACTSVVTGAHTLLTVADLAAVNEGQQLLIYNEGSSPTCAANDLVFAINPGNGSIFTLPFGSAYFSAGIAIKFASAPASTGERLWYL